MKYGMLEYVATGVVDLSVMLKILVKKAESAILIDYSGSMDKEIEIHRDAIRQLDMDDYGHVPIVFFNTDIVLETTVSRVIMGDWATTLPGCGTVLDDKLLRRIKRKYHVRQVIALTDGMFVPPVKYPVNLAVILPKQRDTIPVLVSSTQV